MNKLSNPHGEWEYFASCPSFMYVFKARTGEVIQVSPLSDPDNSRLFIKSDNDGVRLAVEPPGVVGRRTDNFLLGLNVFRAKEPGGSLDAICRVENILHRSHSMGASLQGEGILLEEGMTKEALQFMRRHDAIRQEKVMGLESQVLTLNRLQAIYDEADALVQKVRGLLPRRPLAQESLPAPGEAARLQR